MGATIEVEVGLPWVGVVLHMLEDLPELYLIDRYKRSFNETELWKLRSLRFPKLWEGQLILGTVHGDGLRFRREGYRGAVSFFLAPA